LLHIPERRKKELIRRSGIAITAAKDSLRPPVQFGYFVVGEQS